MARVALSINPLSRFTLSTFPVHAELDAVDGNVVIGNDGTVFLLFENTSGVTRTIDVTIPGAVDVDLVAPVRSYTIADNEDGYTGVFPVDVYGTELLIDVSGIEVEATVYRLR